MLHFTVIGALLFLLDGLVGQNEPDAPRQIVVSEGRMEALAEGFKRTWLRPPTAEELRHLVEDYIAEEVYYREARALGLDSDDIVIRRRLRQKMEFLADDLGAGLQPTDDQLETYLQENLQAFAAPTRSTFVQVYFRDARGEEARQEAKALVTRLRAGHEALDAEHAGDASLLPPHMESAYPADIAAVFGDDFANRIETAAVGEWLGPLDSSVGIHVVRVERREAGKTPELEDVRPLVVRHWQAREQRQLVDETLARLLARYEVQIDAPFDQLLMPQ